MVIQEHPSETQVNLWSQPFFQRKHVIYILSAENRYHVGMVYAWVVETAAVTTSVVTRQIDPHVFLSTLLEGAQNLSMVSNAKLFCEMRLYQESKNM